MEKQNIKVLVEGGISIGLAVVLSFLSIYTMPQGGSVSLAALPIVVFAMRNGWRSGTFVGLVYGILQLIISPYHVVHPVSIICDYLLVGAILGLVINNSSNIKFSIRFFALFIVRYLSYVVSGAVVFASYAGDQNPWIYSFGYNTYALVEKVLVFIVVMVLKKFSPIFKK